MSYYWKPYVPVAKRRQKAASAMAALLKKGVDIQPVQIAGRTIANTFWGRAWCEHLESFSDYDNRLPRGRTYVRNGSVFHLAIKKGKVEAKVSGSEIYEIRVGIKTLAATKWNSIKKKCAGKIGSLLELLRGNLSNNIMEVVTDRRNGLFPLVGEISFDCDCPDWAVMCKHVAAVLYGVGARLDQDPGLLFHLRGVRQDELIAVDPQIAVPTAAGGAKQIASGDLGDVFGIDLATDGQEEPSVTPKKRTSRAKKKPSTKNEPPIEKKASRGRTAKTATTDKTRKVPAKSTGGKSNKKKSDSSGSRSVVVERKIKTAKGTSAKKNTRKRR